MILKEDVLLTTVVTFLLTSILFIFMFSKDMSSNFSAPTNAL